MDNTQEIRIEPALDIHAESCARISLQVYVHIHEVYAQRLGQELHDDLMGDWEEKKAESVINQIGKGQSFVALVGDRVVGFAGYRLDGQCGVISNNAVDPEFRGRGIAGLLYAKCLEEMRKAGMKYARVHTGLDDGHAPARRAYEKAGFQKNLPSVMYYQEL